MLSATDFDGHLELAAPVRGQGHFGARMALHGPGQIGPLVWEVDDIDGLGIERAHLGRLT